MSLTIKHLEDFLTQIQQNAGKPGVPTHAYVEVGRYKPYHPSIVKAAERRGYRVEGLVAVSSTSIRRPQPKPSPSANCRASLGVGPAAHPKELPS